MRAVNLIPAEQRAGTRGGPGASGGAAYAVLAMIGGIALLALLYGMAHHQVSDRRAEAAAITAKAERAQASAAALAPYTSFVALREQRVQAVTQLVDSRFDWAHAVHELGRVLPKDASILSLDGEIPSPSGSSSSPPASSTPSAGASASPAAASSSGSAASGPAAAAAGAAVTSATPTGSVPTFTLVGCATSQAEVARTLDRLRLIDGVSEVQLVSSAKASTESSASSSAGGCPSDDPTFTTQIVFDPLPAAPASKATLTANSVGGAG